METGYKTQVGTPLRMAGVDTNPHPPFRAPNPNSNPFPFFQKKPTHVTPFKVFSQTRGIPRTIPCRTNLGVDSPFFSTIVLSKNRMRFPSVSEGFLERFGSLVSEWGRYPLEQRQPRARDKDARKATGSNVPWPNLRVSHMAVAVKTNGIPFWGR